MSLVNDKKKEDVQKIILALLMSRKGPTPLSQLDKEYVEQEDERIPWKEFGYTSLLDFLRTMPECIRIETRGGTSYVQGIPTDRTKHVNSLVTRQRSPRPRRKTGDRRKQHTGGLYYPHVKCPRACVPADIMSPILRLVRQSGEQGVSTDYVLQKINEQIPHSNITVKDLQDYIKEIPHELYTKNNVLYAVKKEYPLAKDVENKGGKACENVRYRISGEEGIDDDESMFIFRPVDATPTIAHSENDKKPACTFIQDSALPAYMTAKNCQKVESDSADYFDGYYEKTSVRTTKHGTDTSIMDEARALISERTRLRLERLVDKYPDGIWCSKLPQAYQEEYKVPLNYAELGFNSVLHFVSYLPDIITYVNVPNPTGDFKLYSAKSVPLQHTDKEIGQKEDLSRVYDVYDKMDNTMDPIPPVITPKWSDQLTPDHVMALGESVGHIYAMDFLSTQSSLLEVLVVEVFNPSFFWVHLRENSEQFDNFMVNLNNFYNLHSKDYLMPAIVHKVGMNCACIYQNTWHRGIIKSVQPDLNVVVVMFYDYGTLKAYEPHAIYFLHRQFATIPAQALPCGLFNVKPREGNEWPRSVTHRFAVRVDKIPLAATIRTIDESDNSMMVTLTDTLEEEDVNLNDWLIQENLASYGKLVDKVDIPNILQYTEEHLCMGIEDYISDTGLEPSRMKEDYENDEARDVCDRIMENTSATLPSASSSAAASSSSSTAPAPAPAPAPSPPPPPPPPPPQAEDLLKLLSLLRQNDQGRHSQQGAANWNISQRTDSLCNNISFEILRLEKENVELRAQLRSIYLLLLLLIERNNAHVQSEAARTTLSGQLDNIILDLQRKLNIGAPSGKTSKHKINEHSPLASHLISGYQFHQQPNTNTNSEVAKALHFKHPASPNNGFQVTNDFDEHFFHGTSPLSNVVPGGNEFRDTNPFKLDIMAGAMPIIEGSNKDNLFDNEMLIKAENVFAPPLTSVGPERNREWDSAVRDRHDNMNAGNTADKRKTNIKRRAVFKTTKLGKYDCCSKVKNRRGHSVRKTNCSSLSSSPSELDDDIENREPSHTTITTPNGGKSANARGNLPGAIFANVSPYNETVSNRDPKDPLATSNDLGSSLRFYVVVLTSTVTYIFHYEGTAWMSVDEFFDLSIKFRSHSELLHTLRTIEFDVPLKQITRLQEARVFAQLDSTSLKATRNTRNEIESILLMPLKLGMRILTKLNVLLPQDVNITDKEKPSTFNSLIREISMLIKAHDAILENTRANLM